MGGHKKTSWGALPRMPSRSYEPGRLVLQLIYL